MLTSPQLQSMSIEDLNARYSNTFIRYDGKVRFLQQFFRGGLYTYMLFYDSPQNITMDSEGILFEAEFLDIRRFPAMWVVNKDTFFFVQQNPIPSERYARGTRDDTYHFWNISFGRLRYVDKVKILEACYQAMDKWKVQPFDPAKYDTFMFPKEGKRNIHTPMQSVLLIKDSSNPVQIYLQGRNITFGTPLYLRIENECIVR